MQTNPNSNTDNKAVQPKPEENANAPQANQTGSVQNFLTEANHPVVCLFTLGFKVCSILAFILLNVFIPNDAMVYLIVILLSSFDFWICKNISGRVLVGLRWWNEVKPDGNEVWIYESKNENKEGNVDSKVFWYSTWAAPFIWIVLFVWDVITFKWIWAIIALICLAFSGINLYGYFRCSKEQQSKVKNLGGTIIMKATTKAGEVASGGLSGV